MNEEFLTDVAKLHEAQQRIVEYAALLKPWATYKEQVVNYLIAKYFASYPVGKHVVALPDGTALEFERGENIAINEDLLPVVFDQMLGSKQSTDGTPHTLEQSKALQQLHKLVHWTPSLDKRQYNKLPDEARKIFDQALTRTLSKPSIAIKPAK